MSEKPPKRVKTTPSWSDVKAKLADFDRAGLTQLISDLYACNRHNQSFLHARFGLGVNSLHDYKERIVRALAPDMLSRGSRRSPSVAIAKKAISEYTKAIGDPGGILELRLCWCETAVGFSMTYGYADTSYFDALIRQYRDACAALPGLNEPLLTSVIERLESVRDDANMVGYGVADVMAEMLDDRLINLPESAEEARVPVSGQ